MPRSARSAKRPPEPRAPETPARGGKVTVRMLTGAHAGRTVLVDRAEAARLCEGWQPQAELVAVNRAETRETR